MLPDACAFLASARFKAITSFRLSAGCEESGRSGTGGGLDGFEGVADLRLVVDFVRVRTRGELTAGLAGDGLGAGVGLAR